MTYAEYDAIDAVRWTELKSLRISPAHYQYQLKHRRPDTKSLLLGRATHCAVFEPLELVRRYALWPTSGGAKRGADWQQFRNAAAHTGREVLTEEEYSTALAIGIAVQSHPAAASYLSNGLAERTIQWTDAKTRIECKARLDWTCSGAILDLKTARSIDERTFQRVILDLGYHAQLAWYRTGLRAISPELSADLPCILVCVESSPPHDVAVRQLNVNALYNGEQLCRSLLDRLAECRRTGQWPGRYPDEGEADLPAWFYAQDSDENAPAKDPDWMLDEEDA